MTRGPNRVHICPVCTERITRAQGWISLAAVRHHLACVPSEARPRGRGRPRTPRGLDSRVRVMVDLSPGEAAQLDAERGDTGRGPYLRDAWLRRVG